MTTPTPTPTPTSTTHRFPVYPLLLNDGSGNVDTTSLAASSPEAASNMWRDFISSTVFTGAFVSSPQKYIWGLLKDLDLTISEEEGAFDVPSVATAIHLTSQLIQLSEQLAALSEVRPAGLAAATIKQLPAEKMAAAERLVTQGCTISAHHLAQFENINNFKLCFDKPYSDMPQPIGWFVLDQDSYAIDFEFNDAFYESHEYPNIVHWATLSPRELPAELRIIMYAGYSGSEGEGEGEGKGENGNESGKFNFIGLEHLFPVNFNASHDSNTANANAKAKVEHLLIFLFMGASRQVSNWHFEQATLNQEGQGRTLKPHAPCSLQLYFGNTHIQYKSNNIAPEVNNCSFLKTDGRHPWFTEVAVSSATLANSVTWSPTVYNNCLFNDVALIGHAPKASLIFNECCFTSTSVDIRNKLNTAHPMLGITLSDCFGTNRVPNSRQDSIHFKVDPGQAVDVFGTDRAPAENKANPVTVKDSGTATRYIRYITLDFVVGADHISDTPYGAAPAKITLMDRPDKYNPVSVNILGPAEVFMSNIAVSAIKCCPHRENHFVGINVVEPPRGTIFTDWIVTGGGNPSKTSVALSYSQGGTNIGVESLPAVLFDVLYIPAIDVDTSEHAAQFDLRYAEKWGKAGAWERARTIGLLRANATEENIAQIERVIERLAPTGTRDSAKPVPTSSIGTKSKIKP